jgi:hypothetical protein
VAGSKGMWHVAVLLITGSQNRSFTILAPNTVFTVSRTSLCAPITLTLPAGAVGADAAGHAKVRQQLVGVLPGILIAVSVEHLLGGACKVMVIGRCGKQGVWCGDQES